MEANLKSKTESVDFSVLISLLQTANLLTAQFNKLLEPYSLTSSQFLVLKILAQASEQKFTLKELKQRMLFRNSDVSRITNRLLNRGLIERTAAEKDKRKLSLKIKKSGIQLIAELEMRFNTSLLFLNTLSCEDKQILLQHCANILTAFEEDNFNIKKQNNATQKLRANT